jgi:phosphoribosylformylglycinamidine synthase
VAPAQLKAAWNAVQSLVKQGLVSAGHDISDGGIATTLLEMAFAGGHKFLHEQLSCNSAVPGDKWRFLSVYADGRTH